MLRQRARVGGSGWVGVLVAGDICVCDAWLTVDVAWSLLARCVDGRYVWGFWFLARGEGTRCVFISWYSIEGTWFREPVASKHQKKYSAIPLAVFGVGVAVVDRKWIPPYPLPISPPHRRKKKDERFSRLAVLGPGRLLVLRLLCRRWREEMLTRTQAGADLDRTVLTLSPATTRRHTPRPHHRGGTLMTNHEMWEVIAVRI
jgi:hypothetical protein